MFIFEMSLIFESCLKLKYYYFHELNKMDWRKMWQCQAYEIFQKEL